MLDIDQAWTEETLHHRIRLFHDDSHSWSNLSGHPLDQLVKAAVLVPLSVIEGRVEVWLTQRSQIVRNDKGDVAFPGGMKDPDDANAVETSLREAEEEVGLRSDQVETIAEFLPRVNLRNILVTPVIGIVKKDFQPTPNVEVSRVFRLPLSRFLSNDEHTSHEYSKPWRTHLFWDNPAVVFGDVMAEPSVMTYGLTAAFCVEVACAVLNQPTQFIYWDDKPLRPSDPFVGVRRHMGNVVERLTSQHGVDDATGKKLESKL